MSFILLGILNSQVTAGGGGAFDLLETTLLANNSTTSVTFSGLGSYSDYKHLQLRFVAKCDSSSTSRWLTMQFNGDSGSNYSMHYLQGEGPAGVSSTAFTNLSYAIAAEHAGSITSNVFTPGVLDLLDFSSTTKNKTVRSLWGLQDSPNSYVRIGLYSSLWRSTNAVTSFQLKADNNVPFIAGSRFSLYGVK